MNDNLIPEGYYRAVAVPRRGEDGTHTVRWGTVNDKKQVLVYFQVTHGDWAGEVLPWFGFFSDNAWERTIESLRYIGFTGDDLTTLAEQPLDQMVTITVEHNEYNEKTYARVAFVNALGGGAIQMKNPMGAGDVRKFAARMKASLKSKPEHRGVRFDATKQGDTSNELAREPSRHTASNHPNAPGADSLEGYGGGSPYDDDIPF